MAHAPWGKSTWSVAILVEAQLGDDANQWVNGQFIFTSQGVCMILQTSPDVLNKVMGLLGLQSDKLDVFTVAYCKDPSVLANIKLPTALPAMPDKPALPSMNTVKNFVKKIPVDIPAGISLQVGLQLVKGSLMDSVIKFTGIPIKKFKFMMNYDFEKKEGEVMVALAEITLTPGRPVEFLKFTPYFGVVFKSGQFPKPVGGVKVHVRIRLDQSGKLFEFK
jgi:hypothetical protein